MVAGDIAKDATDWEPEPHGNRLGDGDVGQDVMSQDVASAMRPQQQWMWQQMMNFPFASYGNFAPNYNLGGECEVEPAHRQERAGTHNMSEEEDEISVWEISDGMPAPTPATQAGPSGSDGGVSDLVKE